MRQGPGRNPGTLFCCAAGEERNRPHDHKRPPNPSVEADSPIGPQYPPHPRNGPSPWVEVSCTESPSSAPCGGTFPLTGGRLCSLPSTLRGEGGPLCGPDEGDQRDLSLYNRQKRPCRRGRCPQRPAIPAAPPKRADVPIGPR